MNDILNELIKFLVENSPNATEEQKICAQHDDCDDCPLNPSCPFDIDGDDDDDDDDDIPFSDTLDVDMETFEAQVKAWKEGKQSIEVTMHNLDLDPDDFYALLDMVERGDDDDDDEDDDGDDDDEDIATSFFFDVAAEIYRRHVSAQADIVMKDASLMEKINASLPHIVKLEKGDH